MNSLTKGIFSSLATVVFLFSPVESINTSTSEDSPYETLSYAQEQFIKSQVAPLENIGKGDKKNDQKGDIQPTIPKEIKSQIEEIKSQINDLLSIVKSDAKPTISEEIKSYADAILSVVFVVISIRVIAAKLA